MDELNQRLAVLETINRIHSKLTCAMSFEEGLAAIASELKALVGSDYVALALIQPDTSRLRIVDDTGQSISDIGGMPVVDFYEYVKKRMAESGQPLALRFDSRSEINGMAYEVAKYYEIDKAIVCSILLRGKYLGYLAVANKKGGPDFAPETDQVLATIAGDVAIAVDSIRASMEVRRAKAEAERMFSIAPIGIMTCDAKGIFTSVNEHMAKLFDKNAEEEIVGTSVFELPLVAKSGLDTIIMQGMEGIEGEKTGVHIVPRADKAFYVHVKVRPIKNEPGDVVGVLMVAMDTTSKVRLENQLERSYEKLTQTYQELERVAKMKSQFIDVVSHELRTPLTVMRGYIDLLDSEYASKLEPKFASRLKIIKANTDKLYSLVESMLDMSRLEKGSLQIHPEPIRIDAILEEIVKARERDVEEKRQVLALEVESKLPLIMGDRRRLKDVFSNIVDNAIKYTPEDGRIQVGARDEGKIIHVWFKDNGIGIPLEQLGKIFDMFHIVTSNELSHQVNRLGLGLPISKGIIEAHGGRIWVESQVGKGSVFHVDLPKEQPK